MNLDALKAPFPAEAMEQFEYKEGLTLTSLKAQYIVERLNNVFGPLGWKLETGIDSALSTEQEVVVTGALRFGQTTTGEYSGSAKFEAYGNRGDAVNAARTRVLSKAASHIGIGNDIFKGLPESMPDVVIAPKAVSAGNKMSAIAENNQKESPLAPAVDKPNFTIEQTEELPQQKIRFTSVEVEPLNADEKKASPMANAEIKGIGSHGMTLKSFLKIKGVPSKMAALTRLGITGERIKFDLKRQRLTSEAIDSWVEDFIMNKYNYPIDPEKSRQDYKTWEEGLVGAPQDKSVLRTLGGQGRNIEDCSALYRKMQGHGVDDLRYNEICGQWLTPAEQIKMSSLEQFCQFANTELVQNVEEWLENNE
jgi:hypothetical protein